MRIPVLAFHTHAKFSNLNLVEASMQNILDILDILSKRIFRAHLLHSGCYGSGSLVCKHRSLGHFCHFIVTNST